MRARTAAPSPPPDLSSREARFERRVLSIWPRFDRRAIRRAGHDPRRVAAMVSRRTRLPQEAILRLLTMPSLSDHEARTWFG